MLPTGTGGAPGGEQRRALRARSVLSRHSTANRYRWPVRAAHLNAWCRIPGNPFTGPLLLMPNPPALSEPTVRFGPVALPDGCDTLTVSLRSTREPPHEHVLRMKTFVADRSGRKLARAKVLLETGDEAVTTLRYATPEDRSVSLGFQIGFQRFAGGGVYGACHLTYLVAYQNNALIDLFNKAGSDKGTEIGFGRGVPHCYAVTYHNLFDAFRDDAFSMLEIGLENSSKETGDPADAPSLRVWRSYFPRAAIYGYDINDFSFFRQDGTLTFQGDQSSRHDLERFIAEHEDPRFRIVIDDGSHASSHQQTSLATLFRCVEPGGLYVIEDLHWQPFPESPTTLEVLTAFREGGKVESPFIRPDEARYLEETIASVDIERPNDSELGVIRKRP